MDAICLLVTMVLLLGAFAVIARRERAKMVWRRVAGELAGDESVPPGLVEEFVERVRQNAMLDFQPGDLSPDFEFTRRDRLVAMFGLERGHKYEMPLQWLETISPFRRGARVETVVTASLESAWPGEIELQSGASGGIGPLVLRTGGRPVSIDDDFDARFRVFGEVTLDIRRLFQRSRLRDALHSLLEAFGRVQISGGTVTVPLPMDMASEQEAREKLDNFFDRVDVLDKEANRWRQNGGPHGAATNGN